jgi:hypothetical protein
MGWNSLTMRTRFAELEIAKFEREFRIAHKREVDSGLKREYRLYRRASGGGDQVVFVPPDAVHLAETSPTWGKQLKALSVPPNLTGCSELKIR